MRKIGGVLNLVAWFVGGVMAASAATPAMPTFLARRDYTGLYSNFCPGGRHQRQPHPGYPRFKTDRRFVRSACLNFL